MPLWDGLLVALTACWEWGALPTWHATQVTPLRDTEYADAHGRAVAERPSAEWVRGRYWLCGPGIAGNPHGFDRPTLVPEMWAPMDDALDLATAPNDYHHLWAWLYRRSQRGWPYRGVQWVHGSGARATAALEDFPPGEPTGCGVVAVTVDGVERQCPLCEEPPPLAAGDSA